MVANIPRNIRDIRGGVEAATVNLILGLINSGIDLHVLSIMNDFVQKEDVKLYEGCTIHYRPFTVRKFKLAEFMLFGQIKVQRFIKQLNPDLIHHQGTGPMLLMLRGIDKSKVIITQHGILSEELKYKITVSRRLKFRIKMIYDKYLIPGYNNYISISEYNKGILETSRKNKSGFLTEIIHNAVNPVFFEAAQTPLVNRLLFVGLVNKLKGVHLILEVMIKLREKGILYSLDIAGGTKEPKYLKMIEQTIQDNGLQSQVTLHGWVNQDKVRQLMETCSVFILPSSQECLPVSVAEAMAAERVVVASDTGGIPEMIKDKVSGFLFVKNDTDQLAGILSYLYNNFEEIKRVAANARVKALEMFCPESVAIQTFNFYNKVRDSA